ncbi:hypothetical protein BDV19DRAFT_373572 [Aspergillus venezuelensis]
MNDILLFLTNRSKPAGRFWHLFFCMSRFLLAFLRRSFNFAMSFPSANWAVSRASYGLSLLPGQSMHSASALLLHNFMVSIVGSTPAFGEYTIASNCRRTVRQMLNNLEDGDLSEEHRSALDGKEFRVLRTFGRW